MAEHDPKDAQSADSPKKGGLLPWIAVGTVAAGVGAAVPVLMGTLTASSAAGHGTTPAAPAAHGAAGKLPTETSVMTFMPFGDVTVNLDEGRLNRYLHLKLSLQVRKSDEATVKKAIDEKQLILQNWLLSHLADKDLNAIRGKAGQNMLRREIRDQFNSVLFADNYERVYDVLFEEFNVQ